MKILQGQVLFKTYDNIWFPVQVRLERTQLFVNGGSIFLGCIYQANTNKAMNVIINIQSFFSSLNLSLYYS